jgi:hypothetical protein
MQAAHPPRHNISVTLHHVAVEVPNKLCPSRARDNARDVWRVRARDRLASVGTPTHLK